MIVCTHHTEGTHEYINWIYLIHYVPYINVLFFLHFFFFSFLTTTCIIYKKKSRDIIVASLWITFIIIILALGCVFCNYYSLLRHTNPEKNKIKSPLFIWSLRGIPHHNKNSTTHIHTLGITFIFCIP